MSNSLMKNWLIKYIRSYSATVTCNPMLLLANWKIPTERWKTETLGRGVPSGEGGDAVAAGADSEVRGDGDRDTRPQSQAFCER